MSEFTEVFEAVDDKGGVVDVLWSAAYADLKALAHLRIRDSGSVRVIDTTALVHESWLKLSSARYLKVDNRYQFFSYASKVMRSVVVDIAKEQQRLKRGNGALHLALDQIGLDAAGLASLDGSADAVDHCEPLDVDEALRALEKFEPRLAHMTEMRYFGGLSETEIGDVLGISPRTVRRDWEKARLLLRDLLAG